MITQQYKVLFFRFLILLMVVIISVELFFPAFKFPDTVKGICVGAVIGGFLFKFY